MIPLRRILGNEITKTFEENADVVVSLVMWPNGDDMYGVDAWKQLIDC